MNKIRAALSALLMVWAGMAVAQDSNLSYSHSYSAPVAEAKAVVGVGVIQATNATGGAGGSAAGGSATSTAAGGQAQGGTATASAGSATAQAGSSSVTINGQAPRAAYAPDILATPTAPCRVAIGASAGWLGGALGFGTSVLDEGCHIRETARVLAGLGLIEAAVRALCQDEVARKALGPVCGRLE